MPKISERRFVNMVKADSFEPARLLYVVGQLDTGGLERQLYYLLRAIDRYRYKPAVAVWKHHETDVHVPPLRALGIPIYSIDDAASRMTKLNSFRQLARRLR